MSAAPQICLNLPLRGIAAISLLCVVAALAGCATHVYLPERFMGVREAFPAPKTPLPAEAREATRSSVFNAPFEDVFRAASVAASNAQLHIEDEQKSDGVILASRVVKMRPYGTGADEAPTEHVYFYSIVLRELGPKQTNVRIAAKVQGQCRAISGGGAVVANVSTLGLVSGNISDIKQRCVNLSSGMWAVGRHSSSEEMVRFLTFMRNNLIAAGVL